MADFRKDFGLFFIPSTLINFFYEMVKGSDKAMSLCAYCTL